MVQQLNSAMLAAGIGAVVSFVLATFPFLAPRWAALWYKREIMLVAFLVAPFAIAGLSCGNLFFTQFPCVPDAFASVKFYFDNLFLGIVAFAGSQWAYTSGADELQEASD